MLTLWINCLALWWQYNILQSTLCLQLFQAGPENALHLLTVSVMILQPHEPRHEVHCASYLKFSKLVCNHLIITMQPSYLSSPITPLTSLASESFQWSALPRCFWRLFIKRLVADFFGGSPSAIFRTDFNFGSLLVLVSSAQGLSKSSPVPDSSVVLSLNAFSCGRHSHLHDSPEKSHLLWLMVYSTKHMRLMLPIIMLKTEILYFTRWQLRGRWCLWADVKPWATGLLHVWL